MVDNDGLTLTAYRLGSLGGKSGESGSAVFFKTPNHQFSRSSCIEKPTNFSGLFSA
jgi:hypothetical protein